MKTLEMLTPPVKALIILFVTVAFGPTRCAFAAVDLLTKGTCLDGWFNDPETWSGLNMTAEEAANYVMNPVNSIRWRSETKDIGRILRLPDGYNMLGCFRPYAWKTGSLTIDGADAVFKQEARGDGAVLNASQLNPFVVVDNGYETTVHAVDLAVSSTQHSSFNFSNVLMHIARDATGPVRLSFDVVRGRFELGTPSSSGGSLGGTVKFGNITKANVAPDLFTVAFSNVEVRLPAAYCYDYPTNNLFIVSGGSWLPGAACSFYNDDIAYAGSNRVLFADGVKAALGASSLIVGKNKEGARYTSFTVSGAGTEFSIPGGYGTYFYGQTDFSLLDGAKFKAGGATTVNFGGSLARQKIAISGEGTLFDASDIAMLTTGGDVEVTISDGAEVRFPWRNNFGSVEGCVSTMTITGDTTRVLFANAYPGSTQGSGALLDLSTGSGACVVNLQGGTIDRLVSGGNNSLVLLSGVGSNSVLNVSGGTARFWGNPSIQMGYAAESRDEINLSGGLIALNGGVRMGSSGQSTGTNPSILRVTGGELDAAGGIEFCGKTGSKRWCDVILDGGTVRASYLRGIGTTVAGDVGTGRLFANGGTLVARSSQAEAASPFLGKLDVFRMGAKGLTIDTGDNTIRVSQDSADADDAAGEGLVRKCGIGTMQLANCTWAVSRTVVDAGTLKFADDRVDFRSTLVLNPTARFSLAGENVASATLDGLVVSNATLELDPADSLVVNGPAVFDRLHIVLTSVLALETDDEVRLVVCGGRLSGESVAALRTAVVNATVGEGDHVSVEAVYDEETGKTTVSVAARRNAPEIGPEGTTEWQGPGTAWETEGNWTDGAPATGRRARFASASAPRTVEVSSAAEAGALEFAADGYVLSGDAPLAITAEEGAAHIDAAAGVTAEVDVPLSLDYRTVVKAEEGSVVRLGTVSGNGIQKTGAGTLELRAANEGMKGVLRTAGGTTAAKVAGALGTKDGNGGDVWLDEGTLALGSAGAAAAHYANFIRSDAELQHGPRMVKADSDVTVDGLSVTGGLIKRGAGTLTVDADAAGEQLTLGSLDTGTNGKPADVNSHPFPADGSAPDGGYSGFTVAEGEMAVRSAGGATKPKVLIRGGGLVGMRTPDCSVQPTLSFEGVDVDNQNQRTANQHFFVGHCIGYADNPVTNATLRLVNSSMILQAYRAGVSAGAEVYARTTLAVTNSTFNSCAAFTLSNYASEASREKILSVIRAKDSNLISSAGTISMYGNTDLDVESTVFGRTSGCVKFSSDKTSRGRLRFRAGSVLRIEPFSGFGTVDGPLEFVFDDAEWKWGENDYTFEASSMSSFVTWRMEGAGLVLAPKAGVTFTDGVPFTGEGGLVKKGAGTLAFLEGAMAFTGPCDVREGTVDLQSAGTLSGVAFTGPGTVSRGTFAKVRISAPYRDGSIAETPLFADCTFNGVVIVDLGFGPDFAWPEDGMPRGLVVANYSGNVPPVGRFRLRNGGKRCKGVFTVSGSKVLMDVAPADGLALIVR